jgi:hypothetical protein
MNKLITYIKNNKWVSYGVTLFVGVCVGALFYPSKTIIKEVKVEDITRITKLEKELTNTKKQYEEKLFQEQTENRQREETLTKKITSLDTEIRVLKSKVKTSYYKLVKPDGTIEERKFTESEVDESTKVIKSIQEEFIYKITEIENRWMSIHRDRVLQLQVEHKKETDSYKEQIKKMEEYEKVEINKRSTQFEIGLLSNKNYYLHVTRDLFSPVFIGVHTQTNFGLLANPEFAVGGGVGMRW